MFERDRQLSAVSVKIEPAVSKRTTNTATNPPTRSFVALAALLTLFGGACGGLAYTRLQQNARPIPAANETQRPWKIIGETAERRRALPAAPDQSDEAAHRQVINDCEQLVAADLKIRACTELIARNSQDAVAYSNRARAHILNNDAGSAIADATRAIEIDPALSMAYVARGISYGAAGDPSRAIADLSKAIEIDSRLVLAYQKRAHFYVRSKRLDLAIADYTRVIELEPTNASAFAARAVVHHQMGNYQKVIVDSTRAIELDPTNIRALNLRGIALSRKRDHDLAIADYNRAIELKSGNQAQLHVNRCVAYLRKNEVYLAISDCLQAAEIDSNYFEAHYNLAMAYRRNGENQKALVALNRSIEINAGHGGAYALRGQVFEALRRKSDAIADYRKALAIDHSVQKAKDGLKRLGAST